MIKSMNVHADRLNCRVAASLSFLAFLASASLLTIAGPADKVDTRIGAARGAGSCPIGPCVPYGSVMPSPDTLYPFAGRRQPPPSGYYPGDPVVGFSQLHVEGTGGTPTYGFFLVTPTTGAADDEESLASPFSVSVARPYLLEGRLEREGIGVRLSSTAHGAIYEFTFPEGAAGRVVLNTRRKIGMRDAALHASCKTEDGVTKGYSNFVGNWVPGTVGCVFAASEERVAANRIVYRIAVSFGLAETAERYLAEELAGRTVDEVASASRAVWDDKLGRVVPVGADAAEERRFFSHLYHAFIQPRNRTGDFIGWGADEPFWDDHYTLWDTWKTLLPLWGIVDPQALAGVVNSFAARAERNGDCATAFIGGIEYKVGQGGDEADNVIADAVAKGIPGVDAAKLWPALETHAARRTRSYLQRGYVEAGRRDGYCRRMVSGSGTLAFAYNDFCAASVAAKLGRNAEAKALRERSHSWTNVWNDAFADASSGFSGFVWGRAPDGSWNVKDDWTGENVPMETRKGYNHIFYEGTPWDYSFNVLHDIPLLVEKCGGREAFVSRLEYALGNKLVDFGNEPGFTIPWLFDFAGRPDLTAKWAAEVRAMFPAEGCPGDDDSGAMGSFYVFLTAGFFPIAGQDLYALHGPMVPAVRFSLPNGRVFTVRRTSPGAVAWSRALLNGKPLDRPFMRHADITSGGELVFE